MFGPEGVSSERHTEGGSLKNLTDLFTGNRKRPEDAVGFWMWRLTLAFQRRAEAPLKEIGLTHLQYVVLILAAWLNLNSDEVSQGDLVEISGVQEAQVSLMVKALKAKKLITQKRSLQDSRVRLITVTSEGTRLLSVAVPLMTSLQAELWPPGPETDQMLHLFSKTLERWKTEHA